LIIDKHPFLISSSISAPSHMKTVTGVTRR
jgi:hypothetical protein